MQQLKAQTDSDEAHTVWYRELPEATKNRFAQLFIFHPLTDPLTLNAPIQQPTDKQWPYLPNSSAAAATDASYQLKLLPVKSATVFLYHSSMLTHLLGILYVASDQWVAFIQHAIYLFIHFLCSFQHYFQSLLCVAVPGCKPGTRIQLTARGLVWLHFIS